MSSPCAPVLDLREPRLPEHRLRQLDQMAAEPPVVGVSYPINPQIICLQVMNTTCEATRPYVATRTSVKITSAQDTTDFSEARHRLCLEVREARQPSNNAHCADSPLMRQPFGECIDVLEESFYWLVSAPALGYLAYLILGF
jgi:hypothetical protein